MLSLSPSSFRTRTFYASGEGSGKIAQMHMLIRAFVEHIWDKYQNISGQDYFPYNLPSVIQV